MNKLRLHLDELAVESFDTTAANREKGTVFGEQCTCYTNCTCPGCPTCDATCPYTCDDFSCAGENTCYGHTCEGTCRIDGCGFSDYDTCPRTCGV
jgi:hypothetical protein